MKLFMGFAVAALSGVSCAESDFNLEKAVMKNLKWIRPPTWEKMPEDMDSFFAEDPHETPEFSLKTEKYGSHEREPSHDEHSQDHYYPEDSDYYHRYNEGHDDYYPEHSSQHQYANDDNDEKYYPVAGPHRQSQYH